MASELVSQIREATAFLSARLKTKPEIGIILGTGLGDFAGTLESATRVPFAEIPHFPVSTVESHAGELHVGRLAGRTVAVMKGRVHYYEGYTMRQVAFPVRVLKAIGCDTLIITNAVGGMNPDMPPGSIVVTTDHINLMGDNPLIELAERVALEQQQSLQRAVFVAVAGPNLETAAEYRFLRWIGADVVGMSLVPENLVAVHGGQKVLALNVITDACLPDRLEPVDIPKILATAGAAAPQLIRLVTEVVRRLGPVG